MLCHVSQSVYQDFSICISFTFPKHALPKLTQDISENC
ncbi:hypothetical protein NC653_026644 [Populus alba x Populus x berolinensis]|uniref:Uncharacterized protein n=1 Tax=Populus alba x Populus x berolinensis TaxID=444605 RepID=A0AAD6Q9E6_9ROSI|nr:hypothetical protein NC653_026644 [Populus alba x Populus x berolinensis]